jgi:hypothetical protein
LRVFEVLDVLHDVVELLLVVGLGGRVAVFAVGEGRVVEVCLLVGVHQILVIRIGVAHLTEYILTIKEG